MESLAVLRGTVQGFSTPFATALGLTKLPEHFDLLIASALVFWCFQTVLSPLVSENLFWETYKGFKTAKQRNNWNVHVVALVHALLIIPLAWRCLFIDALDKDRAYGWDGRAGTVQAVACGYFLWDTIESLVHFSDIGFVIHGFACFVIYLLSFQPFIAYYGSRFLLWELSTPFLNIHWFLDKMNMSGSRLQLVNGVALLLTFASVRLVHGSIMSYQFFHTLYAIKDDISLLFLVVYGGGNVVLNSLNWFWFAKMLLSLKKRMGPSISQVNDRPLEEKVVIGG